MLKSILLFLVSVFFLFNLSCIRQHQPRLSQSLEKTVVLIDDIVNLKCILQTGDRLDQKVHRTDASKFTLETQRGFKEWDPVEEGSIVYNGFNSEGDKTKGHINNFGYVSIKRVKDRSSQSSISCSNLITPELHPLFIGKSHYNYKVRFQVIGNYIRVLIVAPAKDIPHQALAYSIKLEKDLYGMPIGGYNAELGYIEEILNSDWEATRTLTFRNVPVKERKGYTFQNSLGIPSSYPLKEDGTPVRYAKISSSFTPFKTLLETGQKQDVYDKDLFRGEWYYAQTNLVNNVGGNQIPTAFQVGFDNQFRSSSNVRVVFKDDFLVAYTLNIEDINTEDPLHTDRDRWVFKIPIQHLDYWADSSGKDLNAGLHEVLNNTQDIHKRPLVQVRFSDIETPIDVINTVDFSYRMDQILISEDYISFVLKSDVYQNSMRFSLLRVKENPSYMPVYMTQKLYELFPAFVNQKRVNPADKITWSDSYQKSYPVELFDLTQPIVYHFSDLTPKSESIRSMGREAIHLWNQTFEKAGVLCPRGGCVVLDEKKDIGLGDIRYNLINLLAPQDIHLGSSIGGYGSSISHFKTGELISATANVYFSNHYFRFRHYIYNYIKAKGGLISHYQDSYDSDITPKPLLSARDSLRKHLLSGTLKKFFVPSYMVHSWNSERGTYDLSGEKGMKPGHQVVYGLDLGSNGQLQYITSVDEILDSKEDQDLLYLKYKMATGKEPSRSMGLDEVYAEVEKHQSHSCSLRTGFMPSGNAVYKLVDQLCSEELNWIHKNEYLTIQDQSPHKRVHWLRAQSRKKGFQEQISACIDRILPVLGLNTVLHEMGHNFSMAHNFKGSADRKNALPPEDYNHKHVFSHLDNSNIDKLKKLEPQSSTVMDYLGGEHFNLNPGGYDVAFVRLFYGGQLEKKSGEKVSVDFSSPEGMRALNNPASIRSLKSYKVCNDQDGWASFDIFCNVHDSGSTAEEIVDNYYDTFVGQGLSVYRNGLHSSNDGSPFLGMLYFIEGVSNIYHNWRTEISKYLTTDDPLYLTSITAEEYQAQINQIIANNEHLKDLYKARNKIFSVYTELLFDLHDKYCITQNRERMDQPELIPFSQLHHLLSEGIQLNQDVSSCDDIKMFFSRSGRRVIGEKGLHLMPGRFSTSPYPYRQVYRYFDYQGTLLTRFYAYLGLMAVYSTGNESILGLMDEPDIRVQVQDKLLDRILEGVNFSSGRTEQSSDLFNDYFYDTYFPIFSNEENLWSTISFPLFRRSSHATNYIRAIQGEVGNVVFVYPNSTLSQKEGIVGSEVISYNSLRSKGGYFVSGKNNVNRSRISVEVIPVVPNAKMERLIQGIRSNELKRSYFDSSILFKKHFSNGKETLQEVKQKSDDYFQGTFSAIAHLYSHPKTFVTFLAFSKVFDHLDRSQKVPAKITPLMAQILQLGEFLKYRTESGFISACQRLHLGEDSCPEVYLTEKEVYALDDPAEVFNKVVSDVRTNSYYNLEKYLETMEGGGFKKPAEINIAKPSVDVLKKVLDTHPNQAGVWSSLIENIYIIELFVNSEGTTNTKIKQLFELMLGSLDEESRAEKQKMISELKENIEVIDKLKYFSGNKLFQELYIKNVHFFARIPGKILIQGNGTSSSQLAAELFGTNKGGASLYDVFILYSNYLNLDPGFVALQSLQKNVQSVNPEKFQVTIANIHKGTATFYEDLFLNENLDSIITHFKTNISKILRTSSKDVIDAVGGYDGLIRYFQEYEVTSPLRGIINNQINKELISQASIIYSSIQPYISIHNEGGGGTVVGSVSSNSEKEFLQRMQSLKKQWNLSFEPERELH